MIARYSPTSLVKLTVNLEMKDEDEYVPSEIQSEEAQSEDVYPNLKTLRISEYVPQHLIRTHFHYQKIRQSGETVNIFKWQWASA